MRPKLQRILRLVHGWRDWLPRYAIGGAWFFAIASMIPLLWLMIEGQTEGEPSRVFGATADDGVLHTVWGLTYSGALGAILLWLEFFALIAAVVMSALPGRMSVFGPELALRMRRIAHGYLAGWAGLWMLGAMHLAQFDPAFWTLQSIFLTAMFACTVYRAWREWSPPKSDDAAEFVVESRLPELAQARNDSSIRHRTPFDDAFLTST